jgi:hypothetical protein
LFAFSLQIFHNFSRKKQTFAKILLKIFAKINKCRRFLKSLLKRDKTCQQHFKQREHFCENILMTSYLSSLKDEQNRRKLAQAALKKLAVLHTFLR